MLTTQTGYLNMLINMKETMTIETGIKAIVLCGYLLVVISLFFILAGANIGQEANKTPNQYHQFIESSH